MKGKKWMAAALATAAMMALAGCGGGTGGDSGPAKPKRDMKPAASVKYGSRSAEVYRISTEGLEQKPLVSALVMDGDTLYFAANKKKGDAGKGNAYLMTAKLAKGALADAAQRADILNPQNCFFLVGQDFYYHDGATKKVAWYDGKESHQTKINVSQLLTPLPRGHGNDMVLVNGSGGIYTAVLDKGELKDSKKAAQAAYEADGVQYKAGKYYATDKDNVYIAMWDKPYSQKPTKMKLVAFDNAGKEGKTYDGYGVDTAGVAVTDNFVVMNRVTKEGGALKVYSKKDGKELGEVKLDFQAYTLTKAGGDTVALYEAKQEKGIVLDKMKVENLVLVDL